jgi:hypothetical protein
MRLIYKINKGQIVSFGFELRVAHEQQSNAELHAGQP